MELMTDKVRAHRENVYEASARLVIASTVYVDQLFAADPGLNLSSILESEGLAERDGQILLRLGVQASWTHMPSSGLKSCSRSDSEFETAESEDSSGLDEDTARASCEENMSVTPVKEADKRNSGCSGGNLIACANRQPNETPSIGIVQDLTEDVIYHVPDMTWAYKGQNNLRLTLGLKSRSEMDLSAFYARVEINSVYFQYLKSQRIPSLDECLEFVETPRLVLSRRCRPLGTKVTMSPGKLAVIVTLNMEGKLNEDDVHPHPFHESSKFAWLKHDYSFGVTPQTPPKEFSREKVETTSSRVLFPDLFEDDDSDVDDDEEDDESPDSDDDVCF